MIALGQRGIVVLLTCAWRQLQAGSAERKEDLYSQTVALLMLVHLITK